MQGAFIDAIAYAVGESTHAYRDMPDFADRIATNNLPDLPSVFGWGVYHQTALDAQALGVMSARRTLEKADVDPATVDIVMFCSSRIPGTEVDHIGMNVEFVRSLGLTRAFPMGVTLCNCAAFISAIAVASEWVSRDPSKTVLIITADKLYDERVRMHKFALLSDCAASCLVRHSAPRGYRVLGHQFSISRTPVSNNLGQDDTDLENQFLADLMRSTGLAVGELRRVFTSNLFLPISSLRGRRLGFTSAQLYLKAVPRFGHCFAADAFINLLEFEANERAEPGDKFLLTADGPNIKAGLVIDKPAIMA
jgi:3-oxoacyl-[acyl-carrier-protein] synthase-3